MSTNFLEFQLNLNQRISGITDPLVLAFLTTFQIYYPGHQKFEHPTHLCLRCSDGFLADRCVSFLESTCEGTLVTSIADSKSLFQFLDNKSPGLAVVYLGSNSRHSILIIRLSYFLRRSKHPIVIVTPSQFVDDSLANLTFPINPVPPSTPLPRYQLSIVEKELQQAKESTARFWEKYGDSVVDEAFNYKSPPWLKNRNEELLVPILATGKVAGSVEGDLLFYENLIQLAQQIVMLRTREDLEGDLDARILEATQAFIEEFKPLEKIPDFYNGQELADFVRKLLQLPKLTLQRISQVLNGNDVVEKTCRARFVDTIKTNTGEIKKVTQTTCYAFNKEKLFNLA